MEQTFGAKPLASLTPHLLAEYRESLEACMEEADLEDYFSRGIGVSGRGSSGRSRRTRDLRNTSDAIPSAGRAAAARILNAFFPSLPAYSSSPTFRPGLCARARICCPDLRSFFFLFSILAGSASTFVTAKMAGRSVLGVTINMKKSLNSFLTDTSKHVFLR